MRAAVVEQPGRLVVREVPDLVIEPTECLVQILACGICNSTDRKLLDGHFRYKGPEAYPGILGHESVGRVIACGAQVQSFRVGDMVLRPGASYSPGQGPTSMYGGMAEYGKVKDPVHGGSPMHQVVPGDMPPTDATMLITLKETLSWLQRWFAAHGRGRDARCTPSMGRAGVPPASSLAILGSGPVGLSFAWFARMLGCHPVIVLGRRDEPLRRALTMGADAVVNTTRDDPARAVRDLTGGRGVDRVIEAVGAAGMIELGLSLLGPEGRLGIYGIAPTRTAGDMERRAIDVGLARHEFSLDFFGPREAEPHPQMLSLVEQGRVHLKDWYTHTVPLAEVQQGFDLLARQEAFKVVVTMP